MPQTLDDLAALAGVSRATVSRVLNGGPVAAATRRRVLDVVARTGYRPNLAARSLASGRSGVVGVVMHVEPDRLFRDPYFGALLGGMSEALADADAGMMLWLGNRSKEETLRQIVSTGLADGLVVTAHALHDPLVDGLLAGSLPTVLIGHRREDASASYVDVDHEHAADLVTTHLLGLGRTRVGHVTGTRGTVTAEDRLAGYRRAVRRAGLPELVEEADFSEASGARATEALLARGVDAIFLANDAMAAGAIATLAGRGVRVPDDVAVAGFDDLEFAATTTPPLTTIRQGVRRQGAEAIRALLALRDDPSRSPRRIVLPTELVVRASTVGAGA